MALKSFYRSSQPAPPCRPTALSDPQVSQCCSHDGYVEQGDVLVECGAFDSFKSFFSDMIRTTFYANLKVQRDGFWIDLKMVQGMGFGEESVL